MKLVLGRFNGTDLTTLRDNALGKTDKVFAAVAYQTDSRLLVDWCWDNKIPLKYWGRFDAEVPISTPVLEKFVKRQSPEFEGRVMRRFHPKIIWWEGYGCYIGSANLTDSAWNTNVEAGCFLTEKEMQQDDVDAELLLLFDFLDKHSSPITPDLVKLMKERRSKKYKQEKEDEDARKKVWDTRLVKPWSGLLTTQKKSVAQRREIAFLDEWLQTMELIRQLSNRAMLPENRPLWVNADTPKYMVGDQFIHAYYQEHAVINGKGEHDHFHKQNKSDPERAVKAALNWWSKLPSAPDSEDLLLNVRLPWVRERLSEEAILNLSQRDWEQICFYINSIHDYSRQVSNQQVNLAEDGTSYNMTEKTVALAATHWTKKNEYGQNLPEFLNWLFYSGSVVDLPNRIWEGVEDPKRKIDLLGLSSLGEISGWALPESTPARNNRTSKGLKSLGFDVKIYSD